LVPGSSLIQRQSSARTNIASRDAKKEAGRQAPLFGLDLSHDAHGRRRDQPLFVKGTAELNQVSNRERQSGSR
jgi:hypothetical protein